MERTKAINQVTTPLDNSEGLTDISFLIEKKKKVKSKLTELPHGYDIYLHQATQSRNENLNISHNSNQIKSMKNTCCNLSNTFPMTHDVIAHTLIQSKDTRNINNAIERKVIIASKLHSIETYMCDKGEDKQINTNKIAHNHTVPNEHTYIKKDANEKKLQSVHTNNGTQHQNTHIESECNKIIDAVSISDDMNLSVKDIDVMNDAETGRHSYTNSPLLFENKFHDGILQDNQKDGHLPKVTPPPMSSLNQTVDINKLQKPGKSIVNATNIISNNIAPNENKYKDAHVQKNKFYSAGLDNGLQNSQVNTETARTTISSKTPFTQDINLAVEKKETVEKEYKLKQSKIHSHLLFEKSIKDAVLQYKQDEGEIISDNTDDFSQPINDFNNSEDNAVTVLNKDNIIVIHNSHEHQPEINKELLTEKTVHQRSDPSHFFGFKLNRTTEHLKHEIIANRSMTYYFTSLGDNKSVQIESTLNGDFQLYPSDVSVLNILNKATSVSDYKIFNNYQNHDNSPEHNKKDKDEQEEQE